LVREAYKRVKANKGAAGVDGESLAEFESGLRDNLCKIWNRMSSGTYFPPPVMAVEIPKSGGGTRILRVPSWPDKLVGEVARLLLEAYYEPRFSDRSHGFRKGRGCHTALREIQKHLDRDHVLY
jgi:RNA-directed DNA polymerase